MTPRMYGGEHFYVSTACLHELHDRCRQTCTFCAADCMCQCHEPEGDPS